MLVVVGFWGRRWAWRPLLFHARAVSLICPAALVWATGRIRCVARAAGESEFFTPFGWQNLANSLQVCLPQPQSHMNCVSFPFIANAQIIMPHPNFVSFTFFMRPNQDLNSWFCFDAEYHTS